jgi:Putative porin
MSPSAQAAFAFAVAALFGVAASAQPLLDAAALLQRLEAQERRIAELEAALGAIRAAPSGVTATATSSPAVALPARPEMVTSDQPILRNPATLTAQSASRPAATLAGDIRLRHERNFADRGTRDRDRQVLRARLRGVVEAGSGLSAGAQVVIGDPDDPNSSDQTLTGFDDDFQTSLDQAWLRYRVGGFDLHGGKIPNPFLRTDLVWDSDVYPEGASASYTGKLGKRARFRATGLYFVVDEAPAGRDSRMIGGQLSVDTGPPVSGAPWRFEAAIAYFDYRLPSTLGGDAGDFRTNQLTATGNYVSDFNLLDGIAALTYAGLGDRWPLRASMDVVRNLGASDAERDDGYAMELTAGRLTTARDWRIAYGQAKAKSEAVLAAFAQDNIPPGTAYRLHNASIDYALRADLFLSATWYHYRLLAGTPGFTDPEWRDRIRFNLLLNF